jgi:uncharacterized RDD family membrane protein YckC
MADDAVAPAAAVLPVEPESAGFWVRGGALFIDVLVMSPLGMLATIGARRLGASFLTLIEVGFCLRIAYQTLTVGRWGQTVGKMAAGVRITRADGSRVGYARAMGRAFSCYLSAILLDLGYLFAAFEPQKRAMHDYLADTRVVFVPGVGRGRRALMTALGAGVPLVSVAAGIFLGAVGMKAVFVRRAAMEEARGDYARAAADYGVAIKLSPRNALAWNGRCWDRALAGQLDGALEDCDQSLRLQRSAPALDSRGLVLLKMKRYDESIASYGEALALDPRLAYSLYGRGLARAAKGDPAGGAADIQAAENLSPLIGNEFRKFGLDAPAAAPSSAPSPVPGPGAR